jgi:hypothetical protein
VKRLLFIALVLASCSKANKDSAPATGGSPNQDKVKAEPSPEPGNGSAALEAARNQGGLGVSGDTTAFDPIGSEGSGSSAEKRKAPPITGGVPAFVATIDTVTVDGKPAAAEITQAVTVAGAEIQVCYDKARAPNKKNIVGTLKIAFTILKTGAIASTAIEGKALGEFELENCVMGALSRMKVSKPPADKVNAIATITFAMK